MLRDILNKIGKDIINKARKNLRKNRDTGKLERSLDYKVKGSGDHYQIIITQLDYGKYLNDKTKYMDKAIDDSLDLDKITDEIIDDILKDL